MYGNNERGSERSSN